MKLLNRRALVIGLGKSGIAAARFLLENKANVTICDANSADKLQSQLKTVATWPMKVITGKYPVVNHEYDLIVISPGISLNIEPVIDAHQLDIPVIGELELVAHYCPARVIAITGTNGKTTTTVLTGEVLNNGGKKVVVGGNIGTTILEQMKDITSESTVVAEVSSFQLETTSSFKPNVSTILNVTPDHLDRHHSFENYLAAKCKIFANQQQDDFLVLNYDQEELRYLAKGTNGKVIFFSREHTLEEGVFVSNGWVVAKLDKMPMKKICDVSEIRLIGSHNLENCLAATAIGLIMNISSESIRNTLATFRGVAHRLESVATIEKVEYVNDSKGTNPDATRKALAAFQQPIVLIVGGKDKGSSFEELLIDGKEKLKALVILGETTPQLKAAAKKVGIKNVQLVSTLEQAVISASKLATAGDIVLLSPACASWDMFSNYEERGELFKKLVLELRG